MPANEQPVIIEELTRPNAVLVLAGKDRPEQPLQVPMRQRSRQVWNPGNDEATTHVMGVAYDPITMKGRWHDDLLRVAGQGPEDLLRQARGICLRGNQCRLSWGDSIVRIGRLKRIDPEYVRDDDIIYNITFEVDSVDEPGLFVFRPPPGAVAAANLRDKANKALEQYARGKLLLQIGFRIATVKTRGRA